jgi:hypothetical protein
MAMPSRRTLRLTFRSSKDGVELLSVEQVEMTTPPQPGERPQAGKNGGHWFELREEKGGWLAHRLIDDSVLNCVEVHSPDGPPQRLFGGMRNIVFEVLLPDIEGARTVTLVGNPLEPQDRRKEPSTDLATFELFPRHRGESR